MYKRQGKSARIADRDRGDEIDQYAMVEEIVSEEIESNKNDASSEIGKETNKEGKTAVTEELPKVDSSVETKAEEQKEEKPAKEVEQKTDEQS